MQDWIHRLSIWFRRARSNSEVEEELRIHLELATEDAMGTGVPLAEARRLAGLKLGSTLAVVERIADQEVLTFLEGLYRDLLFGCRVMKRAPVFSITAVLILALGIGANTAIFSLLYGLFLRSLPVNDPGELASVAFTTGRQNEEFETSTLYHLTEEFRLRQHSFSDISYWDFGSVNITDAAGTLRLYDAELVSDNALQLLGVTPRLGRFVTPSARGLTVVLAYSFWNDRFCANPNVIGQRIQISGAAATIIGVAPREFHGVIPGLEPRVYLPLRFVSVMAGRELIDDPQIFYSCAAIGRLRPGATLKSANAEAGYQSEELIRQFIPADVRRREELDRARLKVKPARSGVRTDLNREYSEPLLIMQGLVSVVLLLCCVNVGGLMMSRVYVRRHEFSVRSAIGGGRWRLTRQHLTESFVIALAGASLGGVAAWFGSPALLRFFRDPNLFEAVSIQPDGMVFWVTALTAGATTILFGTVPALRAAGSDPGWALASRRIGVLPRNLGSRALISVQVALSLVLVAIATLLSQSLVLMRGQHTGFNVDRVTIQTPPFHQLPEKGNQKLDVYQRVVDRVEEMPGIQSAAVTWFTPMSNGQATGNFRAAGENAHSFRSQLMAFNRVGPGYFRTMETHILAGREFERAERNTEVCVLNSAAAAYLFPHGDALGQYVKNEIADGLDTPGTCRVIGIAEDAKFARLRDPSPRTIYYPLSVGARGEIANLVFLINAATKQQAMEGYRAALKEIAPSMPIVLFATLREQMDAALGSERLIALSSTLFAGLALLLSAIGLYGLLSSSVAQRTGELGVRIALGAQRRAVLRLILSEALALTGMGILLGAIIFLSCLVLVEKMLFGVSKFEPAILIGSLALLVTVSVAAALVPAFRAASIDPMRAVQTG